MDELSGDDQPEALQQTRRRRWVAGSLGLGLLTTAAVAWALVVDGPVTTPETQADSESSTAQPRDGQANGSQGDLKRVGTDPAPAVSNVPIGTAEKPAKVDDVTALVDASEPNTHKAAEIAQVEEQATVVQAESAATEKDVTSAINEYLDSAEGAAALPEGAEEDAQPEDGLNEVADQLSQDVADHGDDMNERLSSVLAKDKP